MRIHSAYTHTYTHAYLLYTCLVHDPPVPHPPHTRAHIYTHAHTHTHTHTRDIVCALCRNVSQRDTICNRKTPHTCTAHNAHRGHMYVYMSCKNFGHVDKFCEVGFSWEGGGMREMEGKGEGNSDSDMGTGTASQYFYCPSFLHNFCVKQCHSEAAMYFQLATRKIGHILVLDIKKFLVGTWETTLTAINSNWKISLCSFSRLQEFKYRYSSDIFAEIVSL